MRIAHEDGQTSQALWRFVTRTDCSRDLQSHNLWQAAVQGRCRPQEADIYVGVDAYVGKPVVGEVSQRCSCMLLMHISFICDVVARSCYCPNVAEDMMFSRQAAYLILPVSLLLPQLLLQRRLV